MPDWTEQLRTRLGTLQLDPAREAEIIEELAEHLEERYRELTDTGLGHAAAMDLVGRELLEADAFAAQMRKLRQANRPAPVFPGVPRGRLIEDLRQDLRLAARMLRKQAALTTAVVLTLALGIGANGAIFALVDSVLLRELPFPNAERLTTIRERTETSPAGLVSPVNLLDWRERNRSFEAIGAFIPSVAGMVMSGPDGPEQIRRQWVEADVFRALGVDPIVGRTFLPEDDASQSRAVVLAESFWRTRFNSDPDIVGQTLRLDGDLFTIVGVVPPAAEVLGRTNVWGLLPIRNAPPAARAAYVFDTVARLAPGVSIDAATQEMEQIAASLAREHPATNEGRGVAIEPLRDVVLGSDLRRTSLLFLGVVAIVLVICFANIASLLLTRTETRANELTIRSMLGADRKRLLRQLRTENLVLSILGGAVGLLVAVALLRGAPAIMPADLLPPGIELGFDSRTVVFCAAAAVVVGLLFSVVSAAQVVQITSTSRGTTGSRTATDRSSRTRELLVVGQVATAVVLLYGAGLLSRTLFELEKVDPGYGAESVLSMMIDPLGSRYPSPEALLRFYQDVEDEVESLPGVSVAAWTTTLPLGASVLGRPFFEIVGQPAPALSQRPTAQLHIVSSDYFRALEQPLLAGRAFNAGDTADGLRVCIVNEALVRAHLPDRSPIGESVARWQSDVAGAEPAVCRIVGVAGNTASEADEIERRPQIYVPLAQSPLGDIFLVVRPTTGRAEALASSVRAAIARIDREQLVGVRDVMTLQDVGRSATAAHRFRATLVMAFAGLALLLAMVGLFGVLAYSVQRRWREYGVRLALGAQPGDVTGLIARGALRLVAPGAIVGAALALVVGQLLGAMLFGVRPLDATTFLAVLLVLVVTAAISIAGPALRAARVDPVVALRNE